MTKDINDVAIMAKSIENSIGFTLHRRFPDAKHAEAIFYVFAFDSRVWQKTKPSFLEVKNVVD